MEKNKSVKVKKSNRKVKSNNTSKTKKRVKDNLLEDKNYKLGIKYLKEKDYDKAYKEFLKLSEVYPKNKKIYKNLILSLTHEYTYKERNKDFKVSLDDYITTYRILATKKECKVFENKLLEYKSVKISGDKSKFLLIAFLGFLGIHKFIDKKYVMGVIYLLTFGLFGIGVIVDLINDYATYESDFGLNVIRYIISLFIFIFGILRINTPNYYYFILISIIFSPFVYSKVLKYIPGLIKVVVMLVLCYLGFRIAPVVEYVPNNVKGIWVTENESTNIKSIEIKQDKTIIKFSDRSDEVGMNEYDSTNKVLSIHVNETNKYRFRIDIENSIICTYTEAKKCIISFEKYEEKK